jgi:transposase InsO family protein
MRVDPQIITFIKSVRDQYGRIGKQKLKVLLDAYCQNLPIPSIQPTTIGKVIKRYHFFYEGKRTYHKRRSSVLRVKKAPKETMPGYLEMDTVIISINGKRHYFITAIDVVTKYALSLHTTSATSLRSLHLLQLIQATYQFPLRTIQTDNGSEFMGEFDVYCQAHHLPHAFTYPRSPRINGGIERFNRTIQEEFIERCDSLFLSKDRINHQLEHYLTWYNETRPHQALGYLSPNQYIQSLQSNM